MLSDNDRKQLFEYFKPSFRMYTYYRGIKILYFLALDSGIVGVYICEEHDLINKTVEISNYENQLDEINITEKFVIDYIKKVFEDEFDHQYHETEQKFIKEDKKRKKQKFISELQNVSSAIMTKEQGKLTNNNLISVNYYFDINGDEIEIFLKVGNEKKYKVKNLDNFFHAINYNEIVSYGKSLSFYHRIDNFTADDQIILELIETARYDSPNSRYNNTNITPTIFLTILKLLKGKVVYINNNPFVVRLNELTIDIEVDENYNLKSSLKGENYMIFKTPKKVIIIDLIKMIIDLCASDYNNTDLISFVLNHENYNLLPVLEEFKNNLYFHHSNEIKVNPQIENDFQTNFIQIEAYFDYQYASIILKTKYKKNNQEISESKIVEYYDVLKLKSFNDYMENLGFKDNTIKEHDAIYRFLTMDFSTLKKYCKVFLSQNILNKQIIKFKAPQYRVKYDNNLLSVITEESLYSDEELYKILKAIKQKQKYYILNKDTIIDLDNENAYKFNELVDELNLDNKHLSKNVQKPLYQAFKLSDYQNELSLDTFVYQMIEEIANFKEVKFSVPTINAKLRPYQLEGYNWLKILAKYHLGGILADDMGLGKTLEMITLLKSDESLKPSLIVCPKSLIFNWHSEFKKFDNETQVVEIYGTQIERKKIINEIKPNEKVIYITSYDSLRNDENDYMREFNYLIIDEGQYIKNINARKTQTVKKIKSINRIVLTGTPIENNAFDLWSLFDFIMPDYLPNITEFKTKINDDIYIKSLAKKIAPFILRRTKQQVLKDLPSKYERIITAELTKEQSLVYDAYVLEAKNALLEGGKLMNVLSMLTRLRQICVDPNTFMDNYNGTSGKIETLMSLIDEYIMNDHRILVFSQFVKALDIVGEKLKNKNISFYYLTGETKAEDRIDLANSFNNNAEIKVFLISLKAGGTGLNLIGADTVIHLDPWWNVSAENQATDRTHRIGQINTVEVIKLICRDTIEQRVIELQNIKKDLIDRLISSNDSSITKLSKDDLEFILN